MIQTKKSAQKVFEKEIKQDQLSQEESESILYTE